MPEVITIARRWFSSLPPLQIEIECAAELAPGVKLGLAVKAAFASGADLRGADLRGAVLRDADLSGAVLSGADQGVCAGHGGEAFPLGPDSDGIRPYRPRMYVTGSAELRDEQVGDAEPMGVDVADAIGKRGCSGDGERQDAVHAYPRRQAIGSRSNGGWWSAEPDVGRVAHGVPARSHRLHGLGNAVVPQIPEILGRAIIAAANPVREEIAA